MTEHRSRPGTSRRAGAWTCLLAGLLVTTGCSQALGVAASLLGARESNPTVGKTPHDFSDAWLEERNRTPSTVTSIYRTSPSFFWESGLRATPTAARSEIFEASLFSGACPGIPLGNGSDAGVFGPLERRPGRPFDFLGLTTSHEGDGYHATFGGVLPGGPTAPTNLWSATGMHGLARGGCSVPWIPLMTLGPRPTVLVNG